MMLEMVWEHTIAPAGRARVSKMRVLHHQLLLRNPGYYHGRYRVNDMKLLYFLLGIVVGLLVFKIGRILGAAQSPEEDRVERMLPIRYVKLDPADEWLRSCQVSIVPLMGIYSDRKYCALVIVPDKDLGVDGSKKSTVYLGGYTSGSVVKPIVLTLGDVISPRGGCVSVILLDFGPAQGFLPFSNSTIDLVISSTAEIAAANGGQRARPVEK